MGNLNNKLLNLNNKLLNLNNKLLNLSNKLLNLNKQFKKQLLTCKILKKNSNKWKVYYLKESLLIKTLYSHRVNQKLHRQLLNNQLLNNQLLNNQPLLVKVAQCQITQDLYSSCLLQSLLT